MRNIYIFVLCLGLIFESNLWADLDCPEESSVHIDTREMLPDGSPNPTYGQEITTGLCGCLGFDADAIVEGNKVTVTIKMVDHEPIRGIELDIYHNSNILTYSEVSHGSKIINQVDENGNPISPYNVIDENGDPRTMTLLGNSLEAGYVKILAYSTSRAMTTGNGSEGELAHVVYEVLEGSDTPEQITFYLGLANLPGTSMAPELLNVVCGFPDEENPVVVETTTLVGIDENQSIPDQYALHQNYPNPFNPVTQISFDIPQGGEHIMVNIYNILGQNVNTLMNGVVDPGSYTMDWNATDDLGNPVASGIYFYELRSPSFTARKKMLLIR